jgi:hypothetical protein
MDKILRKGILSMSRHFDVCVHDACLRFETNAESFYAEIMKEFGNYGIETCKTEGRIRVFEGEKFDFGVPEGAVRDSIVFPSTAMYIHGGRIFLVEEGKYLITIDPAVWTVEAHVRSWSPVFEKMRFIAKRLLIRLLEERGVVSIHGAAVCDDEGSMLFTGVSGSGKTTSLLTMLEKGYRMVTDDVILVKGEVILPFHLRSMIHSDMLRRFHSLSPETAGNSTWVPEANGWWLNLGDLYPFQRDPTAPKAVFCTHVWNSNESSLSEVEPSKMLLNLIRNYTMESGPIFHPTSEQLKTIFSVYSKILEDKPCFNLYIGRDLEKLSKTVEEAVK